MSTGHAFEDDGDGDCRHCPLPAEHPTHRSGRPINLLSKEEGMALAATSRASEEFRRTFFLAMAEVATRQQFLTTNDAWDLLESRGYRRSGSAQAVGTTGPSGAALGLWDATQQTDRNTSGNLHSADDGVRVYQSRIVGREMHEVEPVIVAKLEDLAERRRRKAATSKAAPAEGVRRTEYLVGSRVIADLDEALAIAHAGGLAVQVREVVEIASEWSDLSDEPPRLRADRTEPAEKEASDE